MIKRSKLYFLAVVFLYSCGTSVYDRSKEMTEIINPEKISNTFKDESTLSVTDFIQTPLTVSTLGESEWNVVTEIIPNEITNTNDTLNVLEYKRSFLQIVNHEFVSGYVIDKEIQFIKHIHVGMTKEDFFSKFADLKNNPDQPFVEITDNVVKMGCCSEQTEIWAFKFDNDVLTMIEYTLYND